MNCPPFGDHGEADAVVGDRIAEGDVAEVEAAGLDGEPVTRRAGGEMVMRPTAATIPENMGGEPRQEGEHLPCRPTRRLAESRLV